MVGFYKWYIRKVWYHLCCITSFKLIWLSIGSIFEHFWMKVFWPTQLSMLFTPIPKVVTSLMIDPYWKTVFLQQKRVWLHFKWKSDLLRSREISPNRKNVRIGIENYWIIIASCSRSFFDRQQQSMGNVREKLWSGLLYWMLFITMWYFKSSCHILFMHVLWISGRR